eukprot:TRINITY_DN8076_c1_g1_i2.p1 TRINITY_DN8076_c1_g1~~TRINITY_DN8076_c1_g1_i2.p1  ORF type:complete len:404 (+),score=87.49 TRINITY_DN8076_c1_g1_i2:102-1313(+)
MKLLKTNDDILLRYKCRDVEEMYKKVLDLSWKNLRREIKFTINCFHLGMGHPRLYYMLETVKVAMDCPSIVEKILERMRKSKSMEYCLRELGLIEEDGVYFACLADRLIQVGVDTPGSLYAPLGLGLHDEFFMACYFGNLDDFEEIVDGMTKKELNIALRKEHGFSGVSAIFIPIMGLRMMALDYWFDAEQVERIKIMYPRVDKKHYQILERLIELGADVNAKDIFGKTVLFYIQEVCAVSSRAYVDPQLIIYSMMDMLFKKGLNPNWPDKLGQTVLAKEVFYQTWPQAPDSRLILWSNPTLFIDTLIKHKANPYFQLMTVYPINIIEMVARDNNFEVLEILLRAPRKVDKRTVSECFGCCRPATKRCAKCGIVWFCSVECQKRKWCCHKQVCKVIAKHDKAR